MRPLALLAPLLAAALIPVTAPLVEAAEPAGAPETVHYAPPYYGDRYRDYGDRYRGWSDAPPAPWGWRRSPGWPRRSYGWSPGYRRYAGYRSFRPYPHVRWRDYPDARPWAAPDERFGRWGGSPYRPRWRGEPWNGGFAGRFY